MIDPINILTIVATLIALGIVLALLVVLVGFIIVVCYFIKYKIFNRGQTNAT